MTLRLFAKRVGMLLLGVFVAVLIGEIGLRVWNPGLVSYKAVRRADPVFHHSLRPNASYVHRTAEFEVKVKTNSLGMRDVEYAPSGKTEFRIVVLGDSFTEGLGVPAESSYAKLLERRLNAIAKDDRQFIVFNLGVKGYSPIIEYLYLKERGLPLHPDLVVLAYDMTDVQEDFLYGEDADFDSTGAPLKVHPTMPDFGMASWFPRGKFQTFYQEHSYIYAALLPLIRALKPPPSFEPGNIYAGRYMHTVDSTAERWEKYFKQSQSYVKRVHDLCIRRDIPFVLAMYPCGHQVSAEEWVEGRKFWGLGPGVYSSAIFPSMKQFTARDSIDYLDMTETFRRRSNGKLYFNVDGHWSMAGHVVAADTLFEFLVRGNYFNDMMVSEKHAPR